MTDTKFPVQARKDGWYPHFRSQSPPDPRNPGYDPDVPDWTSEMQRIADTWPWKTWWRWQKPGQAGAPVVMISKRADPGTARCSCPEETPNEVSCFQRHPDGSVTCGVCGGWNQTCPECGESITSWRDHWDEALGRHSCHRKYHVIVADPPWAYPEGWPGDSTSERSAFRRSDADPSRRSPLPYPSMTMAAIGALPVDDWAAPDAHLFCWTTNRYLRHTYTVVEAWGFRPSQIITWCKSRRGIGPGGLFASTSEFIVYARRGKPAHTTRSDSTWFSWPRAEHSRKPEAFLDLVESLCPGPYLELFARRQRLGWDTWGDQALQHVEVAP